MQYTILKNAAMIHDLMDDHLSAVDRLRNTQLEASDTEPYTIAYKAIMGNVGILSDLTAKQAKKVDFDALVVNLAKACFEITQATTSNHEKSLVYDEVNALFYKSVNYIYAGDDDDDE